MIMAIDLFSGSGAGWVLLTLPWLLLAAAAWRAVHGARQRTSPVRSGQVMALAMTLRDEEAGAAVHRREPSSPVPASLPETRTGEGHAGGAGPPSPPPAPAEPAPEAGASKDARPSGVQDGAAPEGGDQLAQALAEAEARGEPLHVSRAALHLARWQLKHNGRPEAEALLLKAVLVATRGQFACEHAEARIELAELARGDGDMTTACEHWQMAKQLFHDLNRREDTLRMADQLRLNRCPSDWILTGF